MRRKTDRHGRNKSEYKNFAMLERYMLNSVAWTHLSSNARAAYIEFAAAYNGTNNGQIVFSSRRMAQRLNVSKPTASRAILELEEHGFILRTRPAHFTQKLKLAAEFRLTAFASGNGDLPTKEFMRWSVKTQNSVAPMKPTGFTGETVNH